MLEVIVGTPLTVVTLLKIYWRPRAFYNRHRVNLNCSRKWPNCSSNQWFVGRSHTNNCSLIFNGQLQNMLSFITQADSRQNKLYTVFLNNSHYIQYSLQSESHSCDLQNGVIHEQAQAAGGGAAGPGPGLPPLHPGPAADQVRPHIVLVWRCHRPEYSKMQTGTRGAAGTFHKTMAAKR